MPWKRPQCGACTFGLTVLSSFSRLHHAQHACPDRVLALPKKRGDQGELGLLTLANRRGDRVKAYLVAKLSPERMLLTASKVGTDQLPDDKGPSTRVQFALK